MEIVVRARLEWNEELQKQVERSLEFAVNRHKDRIDRISISLTDLNGPRGGQDKLCHITAEVRGAKPVMILEQGDDLLAVIGRAARRLGQDRVVEAARFSRPQAAAAAKEERRK